MNKNYTGDLVSIVVPIFNVETYIVDCIKSILNQSYEKLDILLINDGSTDSSGSIAQQFVFTDERVRYFERINSGVSATRNFGIDNSLGEFIVFVDADDILLEDFVEHFYSICKEYKADYVISNRCYKFPNDSIITDADYRVNTINRDLIISDLLFPGRIDIGCWNKMYSKDLLINNNLRFDNNLTMGEGLLFIVRVAQCANRIMISNRRLYCYRKNNLSSATTVLNIEKFYIALLSLSKIAKILDLSNKKIYKSYNFHVYLTKLELLYTIYLIKGYRDYKDFRSTNYLTRKLYYLFFSSFNYKLFMRYFIILFFPFLLKFKLKR